jgi:hypothetical protein
MPQGPERPVLLQERVLRLWSLLRQVLLLSLLPSSGSWKERTSNQTPKPQCKPLKSSSSSSLSPILYLFLPIFLIADNSAEIIP